MIFKSKQVNTDPEPFVYPEGRRDVPWFLGYSGRFDPRPEYDVTRDPSPYVAPSGSRHAYPGFMGAARLTFYPRRDHFDNPVNPILVASHSSRNATRIGFHKAILIDQWATELSILDWSSLSFDPSPAQIDHARRVLTRLANHTKES